MAWDKEHREKAKRDNMALFDITITGKGGKKPGTLRWFGPVTAEEEKEIDQFIHNFMKNRAAKHAASSNLG